jgi:hypothetical protein
MTFFLFREEIAQIQESRANVLLQVLEDGGFATAGSGPEIENGTDLQPAREPIISLLLRGRKFASFGLLHVTALFQERNGPQGNLERQTQKKTGL